MASEEAGEGANNHQDLPYTLTKPSIVCLSSANPFISTEEQHLASCEAVVVSSSKIGILQVN